MPDGNCRKRKQYNLRQCEQITAVEIRRIRCDKFNLNRPLGKLTFSRCRSGRYGMPRFSVFMTENAAAEPGNPPAAACFRQQDALNGFMVISCGFSFFKMNSICRTVGDNHPCRHSSLRGEALLLPSVSGQWHLRDRR